MNFRVVLASMFLLAPVAAQAQSTDPVDRNNAGPFAGAVFNFGQAKADDSDSGLAYLAGAEVGYVVKRDTWNRIEFGLELTTGKASVGGDIGGTDVDLNINFGLNVLGKAGYGYSLGDHAMGIFRVGLGFANGEAELEGDGQTADLGDVSGLVWMVGYDVVFPVNETLDFTIGANYRSYNLDFDDAGGSTEDSLSVIAANTGVRLRF